MKLHELGRFAASEAIAVKRGNQSLSYAELEALAARIAHALAGRGLHQGDRVALWMEKGPVAVAIMLAALRSGAIYVPIDPGSPVERARRILAASGSRALLTTSARSQALGAERGGAAITLCVDDASWSAVAEASGAPVADPGTSGDDAAYILHTSGSTGIPKGVTVSHDNAMAFVQWAIGELQLGPADRLANHAGLHFDLSVLDVYGALHAGASVRFVAEEIAGDPVRLVEWIRDERPTIWYSVPSALVMMMDHGGLLDVEDCSLRAIVFAGEVFPVPALRRLRARWPRMRLLNFYGPTETNVCTFHEVFDVPAGPLASVPIGRACAGNRVWAETETGAIAGAGEVGELCVCGPTVMLGYWGQAPTQARTYRTGDLVRVHADESFTFLGRRDGMVKVRGQRIELGEIAAVLRSHPAVRDAAVAVSGEGLMAKLVAFVVVDRDQPAPSLLELKRLCQQLLPHYMIVDKLRVVERLPRTRNGKLDASALAAWLEPRGPQAGTPATEEAQ